MRFAQTAALFCMAGITAAAQTVLMPEVTLEPHDGKTHFYLGEPIRLDMVFRNTSAIPMMLNITDYGDLADKVSISPTEGWIQWRGHSAHDYATVQTLTSHAERLTVRVDDGYIFRKPGHYTIRVTEHRVSGGTMGKSTAIPPTLTNGVEIDLEEMTEGMEADIVRQVQNEVANAPVGVRGQRIREAAFTRLAALQGDDAMAEKVRLIVAADDGFRGLMPVAMATTRNLPRQLELLQAAWRNPANPPRWDEPAAMDETRRLMANMPLRGWQPAVMPRKPTDAEQQLIDAHNRDMEDLLTSMPQRTGESRTVGAYYLLEFRGGLTEAQLQQAHEYAVEEFPHMDHIMQGMLLQTAHPPLRDPRLVPTLKATLDKNPSDREPVIAALELTSGDDQKQVLIHAICAPGFPIQLTTLAAWHGDRLPEVDTCLADHLKSPPGDHGNIWEGQAILAARYATPAILPQIKAGWNANAQDNVMLAVLMRMAPSEAVTLLDRTTSQHNQPFYPVDTIYESLHQPFPPEVLSWLRQHLVTASGKTEPNFAYQLAHHGESTDEALIEKQLADLRKTWAPRVSEVRAATDWRSEAGEASAAERDLVSSLRNATVWKLSEDKLQSIAAGCMSDDCRRAAGARIDH